MMEASANLEALQSADPILALNENAPTVVRRTRVLLVVLRPNPTVLAQLLHASRFQGTK